MNLCAKFLRHFKMAVLFCLPAGLPHDRIKAHCFFFGFYLSGI